MRLCSLLLRVPSYSRGLKKGLRARSILQGSRPQPGETALMEKLLLVGFIPGNSMSWSKFPNVESLWVSGTHSKGARGNGALPAVHIPV